MSELLFGLKVTLPRPHDFIFGGSSLNACEPNEDLKFDLRDGKVYLTTVGGYDILESHLIWPRHPVSILIPSIVSLLGRRQKK